MRVYLAGRYARREELAGYAAELRAMGHVVTARWLDGHHQAEGATAEQRCTWAEEDYLDLAWVECCISFTEQPRVVLDKPGRGGRHVEFGVALALGLRLIVVGWRENVFHCLPRVEYHPTWDEALRALGGQPGGYGGRLNDGG